MANRKIRRALLAVFVACVAAASAVPGTLAAPNSPVHLIPDQTGSASGTEPAAIQVLVDGRPLTFDVPPFIQDGTTLVPVRAIFETLGATVVWAGDTRTVAADRGTTTIQLQISNPVAQVNGNPVTLLQAPTILNGRTLVPLRFVSEALGATVNWDGATRTITICCTPPDPTVLPGWKLAWHDEFQQPDGSPPDQTKWSYALGAGLWGNNELEYYTDRTANVRVEHGHLLLQALQEEYRGSHYTSARLLTKHKGDWLYGRIAVRARLPHGDGVQGIWPAIWLMPTDSTYGAWPRSGEVDIMEMIGRQPLTVHGTLHFGLPHTQLHSTYNLPDDGFHEYALEWEPGELRWYVDGNLYHRRQSSEWFSSGGDRPAPFDQRFYLILNLAVGGRWPGNPDATSVFPQTMEVEYVRVYQRS